MQYIIDSHCHFYPNYSSDLWIKSAFDNLNEIVKINNFDKEKCVGCIVLTERESENYFNSFKELIKNNPLIAVLESDKNNMTIYNTDKMTLQIFPGSQNVSIEGIEVLSFGLKLYTETKLSLKELLEYSIDQSKLTCIPWSYGKWLGKGKTAIYDSLLSLNQKQLDSVFIGDICGRPFFDQSVKKISTAFNLPLLHGSDPLPISGEEKYILSKSSIIFDSDTSKDFWYIFKNEIQKKNYINSQTSKAASSLTGLLRQIRLRIC